MVRVGHVVGHQRISYVRLLRRRCGLDQAELAFLIGTKSQPRYRKLKH